MQGSSIETVDAGGPYREPVRDARNSVSGLSRLGGLADRSPRSFRAAPMAVEDPHGELVARKGREHETACLAGLRERCGDVVRIPNGAWPARVAATLVSDDARHTAHLPSGTGRRSLDQLRRLLVRVASPCPPWAWSYEPWDAKLARSPRPEHLLQIALYGDLLATVQGCSAVQGWLMLGTGDHAVPYVAKSFHLDEVRYYVRRAAGRLEAFAADLPTELTPEPCAYCDKCHWLGECEARWEAEDHLCRVADISKQQMQRLSTAGVRTLALLAD